MGRHRGRDREWAISGKLAGGATAGIDHPSFGRESAVVRFEVPLGATRVTGGVDPARGQHIPTDTRVRADRSVTGGVGVWLGAIDAARSALGDARVACAGIAARVETGGAGEAATGSIASGGAVGGRRAGGARSG